MPQETNGAEPRRDIVVIGASSGGLAAVKHLLQGLSGDLPAALFVVIHTASSVSESHLVSALEEHSALPVVSAGNGEEIRLGRVYAAPPDQHLLVEKSRLYTTRGPKENRCRPAVDPLFRSAAQAHGPGVIGVVLTGQLDDGTAGLGVIKDFGGTAVVQDPAEAEFPGMPQSALDNVQVDHCVPLAEMPCLLSALVRTRGKREPRSALASQERSMIGDDAGATNRSVPTGKLVPLSCPECGGPLSELPGDRGGYRCTVGHAYSSGTLAAELSQTTEKSLWVALRTMEERARLLRQMARDHDRRGHNATREYFEQAAEESEQHAAQIRSLLHAGTPARSAD